MGTAERVIVSDHDGHFISLVFQLPQETPAATSDFWERRGTSEEGVVAVEVGAGPHVGDRRRSVAGDEEEPGECESIPVR